MVMRSEPVADALDALRPPDSLVILLDPGGEVFAMPGRPTWPGGSTSSSSARATRASTSASGRSSTWSSRSGTTWSPAANCRRWSSSMRSSGSCRAPSTTRRPRRSHSTGGCSSIPSTPDRRRSGHGGAGHPDVRRSWRRREVAPRAGHRADATASPGPAGRHETGRSATTSPLLDLAEAGQRRDHGSGCEGVPGAARGSARTTCWRRWDGSSTPGARTRHSAWRTRSTGSGSRSSGSRKGPPGSIASWHRPVATTRLRGRAFLNAGFMPFWMGDDERAAELFGRALEIGRGLGDRAADLAGPRRPRSRGAADGCGRGQAARPRGARGERRTRPTNRDDRTRSTCWASVPRSPATCPRPATG